MKFSRLLILQIALALGLIHATANGQEGWPAEPPAEAPEQWGSVSANFEEIPYPYPVQFLSLKRYGQDMRMAYMDVAPTGRSNGQTIF